MKKGIKSLREMKKSDLDKKLVELREDLRSIRFKAEGAKSKNVKESLFIRRQVARILTILKQAK